MLKYALSVRQSLLFTYLSFVGCQKKYFQRSLHLNYELPEALYRDGDIYWEYENDVDFNKAFLDKRTLNKAVGDFNKSLEKATTTLQKTTALIKRANWRNKDKFKLYLSFTNYIESYFLSMPFLFHFWNTEYLIIQKLKEDFKNLFGKKGDETLQKVLVPSQDTYFSRERKSLEEIKIYMYNKKDPSKLEDLLKKHLDTFGFTLIVFGIGKVLDESTLLERIKSDLNENTVKKIRSHREQEEEDKKVVQQILRKLSPHKGIHQLVKLAQELMFWKNQRLDIFLNAII